MCSEYTRFPFEKCRPLAPERPLLLVHLKNLHSPDTPGISFPALIDTGADVSLAPREIGDILEHDFAKGDEADRLRGVGGDSSSVYCHQVQIDIIPPKNAGEEVILDSLAMPLRFVDQKLSFILLGQSDFLEYFDFRQVRRDRYFELRRTD